ncbi:MAG TPA: pitrilysin family protein [Thermoanaerobaculia bacterium]|nr:pitrilysin family protein [Thermoanaerobaculia bacterium]
MSSPATTSSLDLDLQRHTLDNGLKVVLRREAALPLVAVNLWYHVGSKNERPGRTGFAHLFEHMLFQGSEHVGTNEHFRQIQQVGGVANGSTWYDRTNYYETVPAHHLDLALWLESDRMGFFLPALTQENLDNQRDVVMNERRQRVENQPYGRAGETLNELLYPADHPYHWPVIGYMEDIAAATLEDVRTFFRTYYTPNNAVISVVGDIDPGEALERVDAWFGGIPSGPPVPPVTLPGPEPPGGQARRKVLPDDVRLSRIYIGFRAPAYGERAWYAADLLASVLAGGKSSPLYRDLVYERQIAQDVGVSVGPLEAGGSLTMIATGRPGVSAEALEEGLLGHLAAAAARPPDMADFDRARNRLLTDYYSGLQRLDTVADQLSQFATYFDDPAGGLAEGERYLDIAPRELMEYAAEWCAGAERSVVAIVPRQVG